MIANIANATMPPRCAGTSIPTGNEFFQGGETMQPNQLRQKLAGVIAFPVTPFKADLSLDLDGLRRNVNGLLKHSVCAIASAAGTGEFHSLSPAEHEAVVRATIEQTDGRVPVMAGVGFNPAIAGELARNSLA